MLTNLQMRSKRVVIAGMIRSASTFSFNIAREYLKATGPVIITSGNSFPGTLGETNDAHLLLKSHAPDEGVTSEIISGEAQCICTIRKPEDAVASWMTAFGFSLSDSISAVGAWLSWFEKVHTHVQLVDYREIDRYPVEATSRILNYLSGRADGELASKLASKYDKNTLKQKLDYMPEGTGTTNIGFSYYDNDTFFHRRHISSLVSRVAEVELPKSSISMIRAGLAGYVNSSGDLLVANEPQQLHRPAPKNH